MTMDDGAMQGTAGTPASAPGVIIILGATGDLAGKKIFPSLWHLFRHKRLPERFSVIGFARRELSDETFRALVRKAVEEHGGISGDDRMFDKFLSACAYHRGTFEDESAFHSLAERVAVAESASGLCGDKLYYLAVPPSVYEPIFRNLAAAKLNVPCGGELGWSRVLVEKPFGSDEASARRLQALLSSYFKEEQIYRIDHYLFKEIVQGIEHFRFSNNLFERSWDASAIERIDVRLLESVGLQDRGAFYDGVGALRDVGQNHLLMMLAAVTMDMRSPQDADTPRERAALLARLRPWTPKLVRRDTYRAQQEGYASIAGVAPESTTETYFALRTELLHTRWQGVPVTLESGKSLPEARKEVVLTLRHPRRCFLCEVGKHGPNTITFRLEPDDEIVIRFWTKKPGFERELEERSFSFFLYEKEVKAQYVEEYAKVLNAAFHGDKSLFVSPEEIEAMWRFVDPVVCAWREGAVPLARYLRGSRPAPALLEREKDAHEASHGALGIVGLGKMGAGLARQLHEKGWRVVGYNAAPEATRALGGEGIEGAYSLREFAGALKAPRTVWLMVPHTAVDAVIEELLPLLETGDAIIDGGNSPYQESMRRARALAKRGITFLDVGVSGGPEGARTGACLMIGGDKAAFLSREALFRDIAVEDGYRHFGQSGAGHFVKMVHNGIEYGMMEAIAEGFNILRHADFKLKLADVAALYQRQSVVTSRLVGWLKKGFDTYGEDLEAVSGSAGASGEGAWTLEAARQLGLEAGAIEHALQARIETQTKPTYAGKLIQTMRNMFGGHEGSTKVTS